MSDRTFILGAALLFFVGFAWRMRRRLFKAWGIKR